MNMWPGPLYTNPYPNPNPDSVFDRGAFPRSSGVICSEFELFRNWRSCAEAGCIGTNLHFELGAIN